MKNRVWLFSAILISFLLILPSLALSHDGEKGEKKSGNHGKLEEGSGSSAIESGHEGKEYEHETKEEGSFSYRRHREEMKHKEKIQEEGSGSDMEKPEGMPHSEDKESGMH